MNIVNKEIESSSSSKKELRYNKKLLKQAHRKENTKLKNTTFKDQFKKDIVNAPVVKDSIDFYKGAAGTAQQLRAAPKKISQGVKSTAETNISKVNKTFNNIKEEGFKNVVKGATKNIINKAGTVAGGYTGITAYKENRARKKAKKAENTVSAKLKNFRTKASKSKPGQLAKSVSKSYKGINAIRQGKHDRYSSMREALADKFKGAAHSFKTGTLKKLKSKLVAIKQTVIILKWPIIIASLVVGALPYGLSTISTINPTPHYYCDMDAPKSIKSTPEYIRYCNVKSNGAGNSDIAHAALALVDPDYITGNSSYGSMGNHAGTPFYQEVMDTFRDIVCYTLNVPPAPYANCIGYTSTVLAYAGMDASDIPRNDPGMCVEKMRNNENWEEIDFDVHDPESIPPGTVFMSEYFTPGMSHTFIWVGSELMHEEYPDQPENANICEAGWMGYGGITSAYWNYWMYQADGTSPSKWHAFEYVGELHPEEAMAKVGT